MIDRLIPVTAVPFSTGTEGSDFTSKWCGYCIHDHEIHADSAPGCMVFCSALFDRDMGPDDFEKGEHYTLHWHMWEDQPTRYGGDRVVCTKFEVCHCQTDPAPKSRAERLALANVDQGKLV